MKHTSARRATWLSTVTALLLLATVVRLWGLTSVPPGLTHDEAANGHDSAAILRGVHKIYFPVGYGREPLYNYSVALVTAGLGQSIFTLRLTTVGWSLMMWVCTVCLARRWWGRRAALLTGAALAIGFWPLMMARVGLRAPVLPALLAGSALAYEHAVSGNHSRWATRAAYASAGLLLGAGFYTYMASRGMPLLYLSFAGLLWLTDRSTARRATLGTLGVLIVGGLVGLPLFAYLQAHPELELRIGQLAGAIRSFAQGNWRPLWQNILDSLPMYLWRADPQWLYNEAGRAALEPALAAAWTLGGVTAVRRIRDRRSLFVLLWLAAGSAPALLTEVSYNTLHAIAAMPAVFLLTGLGLDQILSWAGRQPVRWRSALGMTVVAVGLVGSAVDALYSYHIVWSRQRDVRVAYQHAVVALTHEIEQQSPGSAVISTMYPGEFHDPYVAEVTMRRERDAVRWVDGRGALFLPHEPGYLYVDPQASPTAPIAELLARFSEPQTPLSFGPDDIPSRIDIYRWDPEAIWQALAASAESRTRAAPGDPPPSAGLIDLTDAVSFGDAISLRAYHVTLSEGSGEATEVGLVTLWEVGAPFPSELVLFAHLLANDGTLLDQSDRLDAPSWQWRAGDRFVQVHALTVPAGVDAGSCTIAIGFYERVGAERLPVQGTAAGATRVILPLGAE